MKKNMILATVAVTLGATALTSCSLLGDGLNKNPDDIRGMAFYTTELSEDESAINMMDTLLEDKAVDQLAAPVKGDLVAIIETSEGTVKVKLLPDVAPKAVKNFVEHSLNDYYDGLEFHRVINDFMIQGGDPEGNGTGGESIWNEGFALEVNKNVRHYSGALAMANSNSLQYGITATNGSQFYLVDNDPLGEDVLSVFAQFSGMQDGVLQHMHPEIEGEEDVFHEGDIKVSDLYSEAVMEAYKANGGLPTLDFGYTVFGQTYEGLEIIDTISQKETDESDKPTTPVTIKDITIGIVK